MSEVQGGGMKWDEMSPRERDELVAEKVGGYEWRDVRPKGETNTVRVLVLATAIDLDGMYDRREWQAPRHPPYTTSIKYAWEVVERLDQWVEVMWLAGAKKWRVRTQGGTEMNVHEAEAPTAPEAICKAALAAKGVDV